MLNQLDIENAKLDYEPSLGDLSSAETGILNCTVYHGADSLSKAKEILDSESIKSRQRQQIEGKEEREGEIAFVEDIIRLYDGEPEGNLDLVEFAKENREILREHATEKANMFVDNQLDIFEYTGRKMEDKGAYGPMRDFCVSVGNGITYHVGTRVSGNGVAFEITVPKETVIEPEGIEGNLPGEIPLEYVNALYHGEDLSYDEVSELENHQAVEEHNLEVLPVTKYYDESEEF
jgi:hypothetical protein